MLGTFNDTGSLIGLERSEPKIGIDHCLNKAKLLIVNVGALINSH